MTGGQEWTNEAPPVPDFMLTHEQHAAPEMLAALKVAEERLVNLPNKSSAVLSVINTVQAAIAKAEGRT